VSRAVFHEVEQLPGSDRGAAGFGSTGTTSA
jgi:dUTPase